MDFSLSDEQRLIIKTTRDFVTHELMPHEREVEETGVLRAELQRELKAKAIDAGLYAANMPAEVGGAGLDTVTWVLYEKELGRTGYALHYNCVGRPSNVLCACQGEQRERYLYPSVRGERVDCLAMTEPGAGSDVRGMKATAVEKASSAWVLCPWQGPRRPRRRQSPRQPRGLRRLETSWMNRTVSWSSLG